uniref:magnesium transporter CorA family protein n=1 Tax=Granulicoccus phenolivorans TaxID=266854 RepID=UPI000A52192F
PVDTEHRIIRWDRDEDGGLGEPVAVAGGISEIGEILADPQALSWCDIVDPDHATLLELAQEVGLDPLAIEDAVAAAERAKATRHPGYAFLTVYTATFEKASSSASSHDSRLQRHRISAFILPNGLITIRLGTGGLDLEELQRRWASDTELLAEGGTGALAYGLLDLIVDQHFEMIQLLSDRIETLESDLFNGNTGEEWIPTIYRGRKELVELRRVVLPMREVVNTLQRHLGTESRPVLRGYYADLEDHVLRASDWVESLRDMITSVFEANLSLTDERLNVVMKKLAGWAAVIAVPTAVTGWFGQNVPYPGFSQPLGLYLSAAMVVFGSLGLYLVLRHYDWI